MEALKFHIGSYSGKNSVEMASSPSSSVDYQNHLNNMKSDSEDSTQHEQQYTHYKLVLDNNNKVDL